ncbi:unnamed protein product [Gordionus sp. m RMFG-2023]
MSSRSLTKTPTTDSLGSPLDVDPYCIPDYMIGEEIGHGSFGQLRYCTNLNTKEILAVKLEPYNAEIPQLYREYKLYLSFHDNPSLGKIVGFPVSYYYGELEEKYRALVMDLLGPNLHNLFLLCNKEFSLKTVLLIALQLLRRLQFLHSKKFLYRDVKPQNFLIGRRNNRTEDIIFIVDFGLSKEYIDDKGIHIPYREKKSLTGTARYMSIRTHEGAEQSRRDDLEGLGYLLIYFLKGALPWQNIKAKKDVSSKEKYKKIADCKKKTSIDKLCDGTPKEFATYMRYVRKLDFEEKPNYDFLLDLFKGVLKKNSWSEDGCFDWITKREPSPVPSMIFTYANLPPDVENYVPLPNYSNDDQNVYYAANKYANPYINPYSGYPICQYYQYYPELLSSTNSVHAEDLTKQVDKSNKCDI